MNLQFVQVLLILLVVVRADGSAVVICSVDSYSDSQDTDMQDGPELG